MENISKYITYKEATYSTTAIKKGIKNDPSPTELESMKLVGTKVFDKVREHCNKPIAINSFYRSKKLNSIIGGSSTSQHCKGEALDIDDSLGGVTNKEIFDYIKNNLEFDQLIYEFGNDKNPDWVHVSYKKSGNRKQILKSILKNNKTIYQNYE